VSYISAKFGISYGTWQDVWTHDAFSEIRSSRHHRRAKGTLHVFQQ